MKIENIHNILLIISKAKKNVWEKMKKKCEERYYWWTGMSCGLKDDEEDSFCTFETCPLLEELWPDYHAKRVKKILEEKK